MAEQSAQEKTEDATPRRRSAARREGNVAKSQDLTAAVSLVMAMVVLFFLGERIFFGLRSVMIAMLTGVHAPNLTRADDIEPLAGYSVYVLASMLVPVMLIIALAVLIAGIGQVGFLLSGKSIQPKFSKLNPLSGAKQLVNMRAGMRFVQSLGKLIAVLGVGWFMIWRDLPKIVKMAELGVMEGLNAAVWMVFELAIVLSALLVVLAVMDLAYQRWQHAQDIKMTKEEVKREMKDMDGDPMMKQRRARVARQLAMQRVAAAVPQADVIVTNPTHFAVALQYDANTMRAPKVVAKGADFMAMRIRQLAALHGVPLVERKPLARALYANVEVGQEVPAEHYTAVAEILAYVYRLSGRKAG